MLLYEAGEALRFDEVGIRTGMRGVMSVMRALDMQAAKNISTSEIEAMIADTISWIRAPACGSLQMKVHLGGRVAKNSNIGEIADPFDGEGVDIRSPVSGMVIGRFNLLIVYQGGAVVHIAHLDRLEGIEAVVEEFREERADEIGGSLPPWFGARCGI